VQNTRLHRPQVRKNENGGSQRNRGHPLRPDGHGSSRPREASEEKWGVSAAAPVAVAAAAGPAGGEVAEAKDDFDVTLISFGEKKIQVIKEIRSITGLGLKEAKELVEGAPKVIKEGVSKDEAAEIQKKIEGAGGQVDVK
jgi:large subunit ribosomal protein L7/L12